jgi:hypothetical protein
MVIQQIINAYMEVILKSSSDCAIAALLDNTFYNASLLLGRFYIGGIHDIAVLFQQSISRREV